MGPHARAVALVCAGGDPPDHRDVDDLAALAASLVIAADAGLHHAQDLGLRVDVVVGDLDSVDADALARAEHHGATIDRHPAAKDETDLELALLTAKDRGATDVVVLGAAGGRLDHLLANALVLASDVFAPMRVEARVAGARVHVVRDDVEIAAEAGELLTLLPVGGPAHGVETAGLRFPLRRESLPPGSTRGVSNEVLEPPARVSLTSGVLLAVLPGAAGADDAGTDHQSDRENREAHS